MRTSFRSGWVFSLRSLFVIVAVLAVLFVVVGKPVFLFYVRDSIWRPGTGYRFPEVSQIATMRVARWRSANGMMSRDVVVQKGAWEDVLDSLSPSQREPANKKMEAIGELMFSLNDGRDLEIRLYYWYRGSIVDFYVVEEGRIVAFRGGDYDKLSKAIESAVSSSTQ